MIPIKGKNAREQVHRLLLKMEKEGAFSNRILNEFLAGYKGSGEDRSFIASLFYGTISKRLSLDYIIKKHSRIPLRKISPHIIQILRAAIYQIIYMDKVPVYAAVNEGVNLASRYGHRASAGFVNGILRNVVKNKDDIFPPDDGSAGFLSHRYSVAPWMGENLIKTYGSKFTRELLIRADLTPGFYVRENPLKLKGRSFEEILKNNSFSWSSHKYFNHVYKIENPGGIFDSAIYREGLFSVKDPGSVYIGEVLDPKPGELVMDVCAAPGGKTVEMGVLMENRGQIIALDMDENRLGYVKREAERMGITNVDIRVADGTAGISEFYSRADRVLVDAPCLGLGVMGRKPEIRYNKSLRDLDSITKLQWGILEKSREYVKPGGILVYSTCSITREENMDMADRFLRENPEFDPMDFSSPLTDRLYKLADEYNISRDLLYKKGRLQLVFDEEISGGFFIAKFMRRQ